MHGHRHADELMEAGKSLSISEQPLERDPHPELGGEGNADGGAGSEEISQCALGYLKLVQAGDRHGLGAAWVRANTGDIGDTCHWIWHHLGWRNRKLDDIDRVVRPGIVTVEEIEELDEWQDSPTLVDFERTRDPQV